MGVLAPFKVDTWEAALQDHPNRWLVQYTVRGLNVRFRISFDWSYSLFPTERNLPLAFEQTEIVTQHLKNETVKGRVADSLLPSLLLNINWLGVVPKGHSLSKCQLSTDLSHPLQL